MLLFYAIPRKDTNEIAHNLINAFGTISNVFDAPIEEIIKIKPMTEHSAILLKLTPQLIRVYMKYNENTSSIKLNSRAKINEFCINKFIGYTEEYLYLICLNNANNLIKYENICKGAVNGVVVDMRKLLKVVISSNASSVIISHNHPSAEPNPSSNDALTTGLIKNMLNMLNIRLLDHVIVGEGSCFSFLDADML